MIRRRLPSLVVLNTRECTTTPPLSPDTPPPVVSRWRRVYRSIRSRLTPKRSTSDDAFLRSAPRSEWINDKITTDRVMWLDRAVRSSSGGYFSKSTERFNTDMAFLVPPLLVLLVVMWLVIIPYAEKAEEQRQHTLKCIEESLEERRRRPPPPPLEY